MQGRYGIAGEEPAVSVLDDVKIMIETIRTDRGYGPYAITTKEGTFTMNADGKVTHAPHDGNDLGIDAGFQISKAHERKLAAFARRLRLFAKTNGTTTIVTTNYEIQVDKLGYTILSVNGVRNKCLEDA